MRSLAAGSLLLLQPENRPVAQRQKCKRPQRPFLASSTPVPCFLGVPNSSYTVTIQLTGPDAVNVCNDLVDPIRTMPSLDGFKVVVGHDYSPYQICRYQRSLLAKVSG